MKQIFLMIVAAACCYSLPAQKAATIPQPSQRQEAWSKLEFYLFVHFGPNTFTDLEWGKGTEKEEVFNPTALDCNQWCRIAKQAGAKGIIITAKHHDGFCLWPSKYSTHTVAQSAWQNGQGDVLQQLRDACNANDLKMGIYLSPWDRNHPLYGTAAYNEVFVHMMEEVVSRYGPFFEFWWDGANGEGPNGKRQEYDWHEFETNMRSIAPNTPVFSDIGPDIRWVGNEKGIAGTTNWNNLDTAGFSRGAGAPPQDTLTTGNVNGANWIPAECDVSIRPGWFYHSNEDAQVKSPQALFDLYLKSVGRGASFLLNVPPDRRGLFAAADSIALVGFKKLLDENFSIAITETANPKLSNNSLRLDMNKATTINCIVLEEYLNSGQKIAAFQVSFKMNKEVVKQLNATTMGRKRILSFPAIQADQIEIKITSTKPKPKLARVALYKISDDLVEDKATKNDDR